MQCSELRQVDNLDTGLSGLFYALFESFRLVSKAKTVQDCMARLPVQSCLSDRGQAKKIRDTQRIKTDAGFQPKSIHNFLAGQGD